MKSAKIALLTLVTFIVKPGDVSRQSGVIGARGKETLLVSNFGKLLVSLPPTASKA